MVYKVSFLGSASLLRAFLFFFAIDYLLTPKYYYNQSPTFINIPKQDVKFRLEKDITLFQKKLQHWYAKHQRDLPWRRNPTLYKTVVSEFMLQQTQVDTVLPYFHRWISNFPDFDSIARAKEEVVVKNWEGLGYYSRARNLHRVARILTSNEKIPSRAKEWEQYPGIGPYTAAAISSISFHYPAAVLDGNVIRILTRLTAAATLFNDNNSAIRKLTPLANKLLDVINPGTHNQAMMELGATVCMRSKPRCSVCPVHSFCSAGKRGDRDQFPRFKAKPPQRLKINRVWIQRNGALLLHKASSKAKRLADFYELPTAEGFVKNPTRKDRLVIKKRGISNQYIEERIYRVKSNAKITQLVRSSPDLHWIPASKMDAIILSGPHRRWINEIIAD